MKEIKFVFSKKDLEMRCAIEETFGSNLQCSEEFNVIGVDTVLAICIPAAGLAVQIVDFILTHYIEPKGKKNPEQEYRCIEVDDKRVSLVGYSAEEALPILEALGVTKDEA